MRFKIDWASLILRKKFTVSLCFNLYLRAISKYKPPGGGDFYLEGRLNGGFYALRVWGACIWRVLYMEGLIFGFSEFYGTSRKMKAAITFVADLSIVYLNTGFITG